MRPHMQTEYTVDPQSHQQIDQESNMLTPVLKEVYVDEYMGVNEAGGRENH